MKRNMEGSHLARAIGKIVRQERKLMNLSQEGFADFCGLHRTYVGAIERGEKSITVETAAKLTVALQITLSQFFALVESESYTKNE